MHNELKSKIGLGTVQFGLDYGINNDSGKTDFIEVEAILQLARMEGLNTLDTASAYGTSEEVLGKLNLSGFNIITKFLDSEPKMSILNSLNKLNVSKVYGFLAHRPLALLDKEIYNQLLTLKENQIVEKIGCSVNTKAELNAILKNSIKLDLIQLPFNYFDNRFEEYFPILKDMNCEIHTRSVFLQGLFFKDSETLSPHFDKVKVYIKELQANDNLANSLLNFVLKNEYIDKVIIGVNTTQQLQENLKLDRAEKLPLRNFDVPKSIQNPALWIN